jgi:multidomain signaling protein FimX
MSSSAAEGAAVPMLVLTRQQDHVQAIHSALRNAGHPVHCTWLPDTRDLADALAQLSPELLLIFADEGLMDLATLGALRNHTVPPVPVLLVREKCDEAAIAQALKQGAQDAVSLKALERLQLVCGRELRAFRLERGLNNTLSAAREYQAALKAFLEGSADAIVQVQEGIVVDANPAWLELYGYPMREAVIGNPLMDFYEAESHAALRGALVACQQGRWAGHSLRAAAHLADGTALTLEFELMRTEFEGEPAVRLVVPAQRKHSDEELERRLTEALQTDSGTGFLHRRYFQEQLAERVKTPVKAGVRCLALLRIDREEALIAQVGALYIEELVLQLGGVLKEQLGAGDLAGRFGGDGYLVLLERGTNRDVEAWAEHVVKKVAGNVFRVGDKTVPASCTVGLGFVPPTITEAALAVADAYEANRKGREDGGGRLAVVDRAESNTKIQAYDKIWVRYIKSALMENRFRLVQQPIQSLLGEDRGMFDVLVRMVDEQGREVLPSEFMPVAERNDLMKNIDRWVIGASMSFCAARRPGAIFVRLSKDSLADASLLPWLGTQLKAAKIEPKRLVFQVPEDVAAQYLLQSKALREAVHRLGFRVAIERFGAGGEDGPIVPGLKPEFVKIDGALMQGISNNQALQDKVKKLVGVAKSVNAVTIAERVEDANTMAVLWQLGIEFIQGYFVHKPEEVVLGKG